MANKQKIKCKICEGEMVRAKFYCSNLPEYKKLYNGICPICKECLQKLACDTNGNLDATSLKDVLKNHLNKPFFNDLFAKVASENPKNPLGLYLTRLNLARGVNRNSQWNDGETDEIKEYTKKKNAQKEETECTSEEEQIFNANKKNIISRWGKGFEIEQYLMLEDIYEGMKNSFDIENRSQEEYLKTACMYQLKNLEAIKQGNSADADKWGKMFDKYMESGKLKPNQLSQLDRMGNINNFSEFFEMVEKQGFVPQFPDVIMDDIDYAIFCYINYIRELLGYDQMELGEVKKFLNYSYKMGQEVIMPNSKGDKNG